MDASSSTRHSTVPNGGPPPHADASRPSVGIVCDLAEENWPSMDLVAEMLLQHLAAGRDTGFAATKLQPPAPAGVRAATALPRWSLRGLMRMAKRYWLYPRWLKSRNNDFDLFHIVDHSYAHLVHALPAERTIVTCHDIDAFRCILGQGSDGSRLPRTFVQHVAAGLRKAAVVACVSEATRRELIDAALVLPERLVVVANGVLPECTTEPDPVADAEATRRLGPAGSETIDLLHVGSTIPRKRIDVLLEVFAAVHAQLPQTRLVRIGGPFTAAQRQLANTLGISPHVLVLPFLERRVLSAVYRRAALVLQPSEREGFGLPVVEAMACGTVVVATDLPVLREVGGDAGIYCGLADVGAWRDTVVALLEERSSDPRAWGLRVDRGLAQAKRFTWEANARQMCIIYRELLASVGPAARGQA
jgi:glycosyltransferase involved in cell wall biosynthesis